MSALGAPRVLEAAERWRWLVLPVAALVVGVLEQPHDGLTWHFIRTGALFLAGPTPLDLYAAHPEVQMGPLAVLAALPFVLIPSRAAGLLLAQLVLSGVGLLALRQVELLTATAPARAPVRLAAGLLVTIGWADIAVRYGHVDDALALLLLVIALRFVRGGRPLAAAAAVALATDCKPWALAAAGLLLLAPRRRWPVMAAVLVVIVGVVWLPFAVADPQSIAAVRFTIHVSRASTIHLLGLASDRTPVWCRPLQFAGGFALSALCALRGRSAATLLLPIAWRMLLDPAAHGYYAAGLLLAASVVDEAAARRVPVATVVGFALVDVPTLLSPSDPTPPFAVVRTAGLVLLLLGGALLAPPDGQAPPPASGARARGGLLSRRPRGTEGVSAMAVLLARTDARLPREVAC